VTGLGGVSVRPNYHRTFEVKQDLARCLVKCQKLDHKIAQLQPSSGDLYYPCADLDQESLQKPVDCVVNAD
jgi:hypothetical protein